jgi:hypothetical protein
VFVLVEKLSPADLLGLLKGRGQRDPEITTALIREVAHPLAHKTIDSSLRYPVSVGNHRKKFIVSGPYLCDPDPDPAFYAELVPIRIRIQGFMTKIFIKLQLEKM